MSLKIFAKKNKKSFILGLFGIVFLGLSFWMIYAPKAEAACLVDTDCDDGFFCTEDICAGGVCSWDSSSLDGTSCDDNNACTADGVCSGGVCTLGPLSVFCNDHCIGLIGYRSGFCDPLTGNCSYATEDCDDKEFCTDDFCNLGNCSRVFDAHFNSLTGIGEDCTNNNYCFFNEKCTAAGVCSGTARDCNDNNPCTDDSCNSGLGACVNSNNTALCDDGNLCTNESGSSMNHSGCNAPLTDRCAGGVCVGIPVTCKNSCEGPNTCTDTSPCMRNYNGSCDPIDGCCKNYSIDDCAVIGNVGYCRNNVCDPAICRHPFTTATCSLIANPAALNIGDGSILSWSTACGKVDTVSIDNGLGSNLPLSGSKSIFPLVNTTYTMSVDNYHDQAEVHPFPEGTYLPGAEEECSLLVPFVVPTCVLTADRSAIIKGSATTLHWTATNALTGTINGGGLINVEAVPIQEGSINTPAIDVDTIFVMTPVGPGGTGSCSITISILNPPPGGLVPCGRLADNLATSWDETKPCTFCHLILMAQAIIEFIIKLSAVVALLAIVVSGFLYILSAGNQGQREAAKSGIKYALLGFIAIFIAWLVVAIILTMMGYIDPLSGEWDVVNCNIP